MFALIHWFMARSFCQDHCALLEKKASDVPTDLREFLKFCGAKAGISYNILFLYFSNLALQMTIMFPEWMPTW